MLNEYNFSKTNMNTTDKVQAENSTTGTSTSSTYTYTFPEKVSPPPTEYGWACPRCNRINAPWVRQCDCSSGQNNPTITWTSPSLDHENWWKTYVTCGDADNVLNNPNIYQVGGSDYKEGHTYVNVSSTQTNKSNPDEKVTAWNTQTIPF